VPPLGAVSVFRPFTAALLMTENTPELTVDSVKA
jgi:hypothetical protein